MKWDECKGTEGEEKLYKLCSKGRESNVNSKRDLVAHLLVLFVLKYFLKGVSRSLLGIRGM